MKRLPQEEEHKTNNNMSSDIRSVPDPKVCISRPAEETCICDMLSCAVFLVRVSFTERMQSSLCSAQAYTRICVNLYQNMSQATCAGLDPKPNFFTFMSGLSRFMAAFLLSQKTAVKVFFGQKHLCLSES